MYLCSSQVNVWGARGEATTAAQNATPDASPPTANQGEASTPAGETHSYQAEVCICTNTVFIVSSIIDNHINVPQLLMNAMTGGCILCFVALLT